MGRFEQVFFILWLFWCYLLYIKPTDNILYCEVNRGIKNAKLECKLIETRQIFNNVILEREFIFNMPLNKYDEGENFKIIIFNYLVKVKLDNALETWHSINDEVEIEKMDNINNEI